MPRDPPVTSIHRLLSYRLKTLIPIYVMSRMVNGYGFTGGHGVFCVKNNYAVVVKTPDISLFQFADKTLKLIGSYRDLILRFGNAFERFAALRHERQRQRR